MSCAGPKETSEADQQAIEAAIRSYLPKFAQAYATGDVGLLEGLAAAKEISSLDRRIRELAEEEGRVVVPNFRDLQVEQIRVWGHSNAFATTLEEWDLVVAAAGSMHELSRVEGQRNRVRYQLQREEASWTIMYRTTESTFE
jgi:hypothetical protein